MQDWNLDDEFSLSLQAYPANRRKQEKPTSEYYIQKRPSPKAQILKPIICKFWNYYALIFRIFEKICTDKAQGSIITVGITSSNLYKLPLDYKQSEKC